MEAIIDYRGKTPNKTSSGVPLITAKIVKGGRILPVQEYIAESEYDTWMRRGHPQKGDILITTEAPLGEVAQLDGRKVALAQRLITLRGKKGFLDNTFLKYLLQSHEVQHQIDGRASGTNVSGIKQSELRKVLLPIPDFPEQRAIAHILGSLDDKIELNRRMNETLEAMVQALFKSWFIDFDPVIDNALAAGHPIPEELQARAALRESLGDARKPLPDDLCNLFPSEFEFTEEMGWIPKGWEVGTFGNIAIQKRLPAHPPSIPTDTPYIGLEHMPMGSISLGNWGLAEDISSGKSWFAENDILFGKLRPYFHKVGVAPVDGVCSTDIVVITPKTDEWFSTALCIASSKAFVEYTTAGSTGTKMPRTNWKDMAAYKVCLPAKSVADLFDSSLKPSIAKILANLHANRDLSRTRDTLLPKLLSGEIRTQAAEKLVEVAV